MRVTTDRPTELRFDDGDPVRAASAVARFGDGWLVAQDDATHAAWLRPGGVERVRVLPPVDGHETFSSAEGTKHLKPDFEAACPIGDGVLLLGSGSSPARMRACLVTPGGGRTVADLTPLHHAVGDALGLADGHLNLEGACVVGDRLRWFQRGNSAAGVPSASVDVDLEALLAAVAGAGSDRVGIGGVRRYDLGTVAGVALAVTDAVALPDGRVIVSAAAEDTPNAVDDGPVVGAAVAVLADGHEPEVGLLPHPDKIKGLALRSSGAAGAELLAVVDADDPAVPSAALSLRLSW
ncbi:hypothetical protein COUCH_25265 [Couchioplanes caeruleus]|uniref:DUF6910 family protein n=1 Tax=Couchioplanes caeruleus TaxID=56438 RepID=UPI0020BF03B9|nr:hypothetical protein [Couchioplanes caeruleus]UQU62335.1 hypothetical protein COUCH_25265 [Couchioplanes caeruleus]